MKKYQYKHAISIVVAAALCSVGFSSVAVADDTTDPNANLPQENYWGDLIKYTYPSDELDAAAHTLGSYYPANLITPDQSALKSLKTQLNYAIIPSHSGILNTSKNYGAGAYHSFDTLDQIASAKDLKESLNVDSAIYILDPKARWYTDAESKVQDHCIATNGTYINRPCWNDPFNWTTNQDSRLIKSIDQLTIHADLAKSIATNANANAKTSATKDVAELNKNDKLNLDFSTDLSNFVKLHQAVTLTNFYNRDGTNNKNDDTHIILGPESKRASDWALTFTLELPEGVTLGKDPSYSIDGLSENGYIITKEVDSKNQQKIYFKIRKKQPTNTYETASEYYEKLSALGNVTLHIKGITTTDKVKTGENLTIVGKLAGMHDELMQYTSGYLEPRNVEFFIAKQSDDGRDVAAASDKPNLITYTFKVKKPAAYKVIYVFKSGTEDKTLPQEVMKLLPTDTAEYKKGDTVTPKQPTQQSVTVADGTWTFAGWDSTTATIGEGNITFNGTWNFKPKKNNPKPSPKPGPSGGDDKPDTPNIPDTPHIPDTPGSPSIPEPALGTPDKPQKETQENPTTPQPEPKQQQQQFLVKTGVNTALIALVAALALMIAGSIRKLHPTQRMKHLR